MKLKTEYNGINLKRRLWHFKFPIFGISPYKAVADLRGAPARAPYNPKFSQFHAEFWKFWQNRMLAPPGGLTPPYGESWIRPYKDRKFCFTGSQSLANSPPEIFQKPRVPKCREHHYIAFDEYYNEPIGRSFGNCEIPFVTS